VSKKQEQLKCSITTEVTSQAQESSGAETNLKVGVTDPSRSAGKFFLVVLFHVFGSKSTISRFCERFCDGQYSLVSFLFAVLLLTVPSHL